MSNEIKGAEVLPDGLLLFLKDGREAILNEADVLECAEHSGAFERAERVLKDPEHDWNAGDDTSDL